MGKTTLVGQVLGRLGLPSIFISADEPSLCDTAWLTAQWERARIQAREAGPGGAMLALDEVQRISGWSETVKHLWDEDNRTGMPLRVVVLGSAPLPVLQGLTESLAGRVLVGLEVKSGRTPLALPGLEAFSEAFKPTRTLLVGGDGVSVEEFLGRPVEF